MFTQMLESTNATFTFLHSTVTKAHSAAEKGSITRGFDALDVAQVCIWVALAITIMVACAVAYLLWQDDRETKKRAMATGPDYVYAKCKSETKTVNLKKGSN